MEVKRNRAGELAAHLSWRVAGEQFSMSQPIQRSVTLRLVSSLWVTGRPNLGLVLFGRFLGGIFPYVGAPLQARRGRYTKGAGWCNNRRVSGEAHGLEVRR